MSDCSDTPTSAAASSASGSKKSIVFIRHAQSEENVKAIRFFDGLSRLRNFQAPSMQQISGTLSLASLTINAPLSQLGKRQILDMHMILKDKEFWGQQKFDLIVCSPLTRAKETCEGLLPRERDGVNTMIIDDLEEATPYEHVFNGTLLKRINSFKHWLANREEKRILVVGHSQYFKKLLGQSSLMRNCDVWQCDFDFDRGNGTTDKLTFEWTNLNLLHRTELSDAHPYDKLVNPKSLNQEITKTKEGDEVHNDLNDDEPTCRICQTTQSEDPTLKLIKPCQCSGSAAHVHAVCLNKWRETSRTAHRMCCVCNYPYKIKKSNFAGLFLSETLAIAFTSILFWILVTLYGLALRSFLPLVLDIDIVTYLLDQMDVMDPVWRACKTWAPNRETELNKAFFAGSMSISLLPDLILCNTYISTFIDTIFAGACAMGVTGIVLSITCDVTVFVRDRMAIGVQVAVPNLYFLFAFVMNRVYILRVGVPLGCNYLGMKLYTAVLMKGRVLSSYFGEEILEYSAAR